MHYGLLSVSVPLWLRIRGVYDYALYESTFYLLTYLLTYLFTYCLISYRFKVCVTESLHACM